MINRHTNVFIHSSVKKNKQTQEMNLEDMKTKIGTFYLFEQNQWNNI